MKYRMRNLFFIVSVLHQPAVHASDVTVGRRGFLGGMVSLLGGLTGRATPRAAPPSAPLVTTAVEVPKMAKIARTDQLISMIRIPSVDRGSAAFSGDELEVLEDWRAQAPELRSWLTGDLAELERLTKDLATISAERESKGEGYYYLPENEVEHREIARRFMDTLHAHDRLREKVRVAVNEWPWSSMEWSEVFAARVEHAEHEVAARLNEDLERVKALTNHTLLVTDHGSDSRESTAVRNHLFSILSSPAYDAEAAPLYAQRTIDTLVQQLEKSAPRLAQTIRAANSFETLDAERDELRRAIMRSAPFVKSYSPNIGKFVSLRFEFKILANSPEIEPGWLAPQYGQLLQHLDRLKAGMASLADSPLRTITLEEIKDLRGQVEYELRTLPVRLIHRLKTKGSMQRYDDDLLWNETKIRESSVDFEGAIRWARTLENLSVNARALIPTTVSMLAELNLEIEEPALIDCGAALERNESSEMLGLEHRKAETLPLHGFEDARESLALKRGEVE